MFTMPGIVDLTTETLDAVLREPCDLTLTMDVVKLLTIADQSISMREITCRWADVLKISTDDARMILLHGFRLGFKAAQAAAEGEQLERMIREQL